MTFKNNIQILIFACATIFLLPGCKKFLDKKQDATKVIPSTLSDMQAMLDNSVQTGFVSPSYPEASCDEYYLSEDIYNSYTEIAQDIYTWKNFTPPANSGNDWASEYTPVYYTNLVLDLIGNISRNTSNAPQWDNVKGSALFFRSYHFLNLLWEYAKAYDSSTADKDWGIALRLTSDFNVPSTRATNQASYEQVLKDTKASVPLLPDYPLVVTRPSKGAAYGLLARCYLTMRDYKNALLYADSCLQLNSSLMDYNGDADIISPLANDAPFKQYNKETVFYCEMNGNYDIYSYVGYVDSTTVQSYQSNDLRTTAFLTNDGTNNFYFKGSYTGGAYVPFTGIAVDEMYLVRAECYIRTGQVQKGLDDINTLLTKRYTTGAYTSLENLSQAAALARVLLERRKELLFRGNRWMDIKRLNKEGSNIVLKRVENGAVFTLQPNDNFYAIPIPGDIIQITGMPQN